MPSIRILTLAFTTVFLWVSSATAFTGTLDSRLAAKPDLMSEFEGSNARSRETIGHNRWQSILDAYLISDEQEPNLFRYGAVSAEDRASLDAYIASLEAVAITSYNREEQKAYWINFYNALTVRTVLEHYPVRSIRDIKISPGFFSSGPWGKKLVTVEGVDLSLDDIEHRILRPIWKDNRIHYAVNCASMGCPDLWPDVFTPDNMDAALDAAATKYINAGRGVTVIGGRVTLSKIYEWYDEDFGGTDEGVLEHILEYARKPLARNINQRIGRIKTDYDWTLNAPK